MSRLLWVGGWVGVAIWSLFAFMAYGLVDVVAGAAMRNADVFSSDPETVEWLFRLFGWVRGASTSVVLVAWGVVSLAILSVPWLFDRMTRSVRPGPVRPSGPVPPGGVIDLDPADYTVVREGGRPGPVPRIVPRP